MTENEGDYLRQCLAQNICPRCQNPITQKFGSGRSEDGVFCSLNCYGEWHKAILLRRHNARVKKGTSNE